MRRHINLAHASCVRCRYYHLVLAVIIIIASVIGRAQAAPKPILSVGSIAEMQALGAKSADTPTLEVLAYHPGLNRGGGQFVWTPMNTSQPDNCTVFQANGFVQGRWLRQLSGPLDVTMCGAWWDNSHDDADALTLAFKVAAALHTTLALPGGTGKVCSSVKAVQGVVARGQGMGAAGNLASSPTLVNADCLKAGWVFEILGAYGTAQIEAPKYYDMSIQIGNNNNPGGCIRWNSVEGGFTDSAATQSYIMHPHAERVFCEMQTTRGNQQIGLQCSKCFDGDFSQNEMRFGKIGMDLEGSDVMCIGCAGPNRIFASQDSLVVLRSHGTFGNMDRVIGNEILYPLDQGQRYDSFIFDGSRSSTIEANHIEGIIKGAQSAIHLIQGFSHAVIDNDIDVVIVGRTPAPHWLVAEGPFVNLRVFNNGMAGGVLGPALFNGAASQPNYNLGGVRQIITHGGNAVDGDSGFPFNNR
jgi:hypothetical protein